MVTTSNLDVQSTTLLRSDDYHGCVENQGSGASGAREYLQHRKKDKLVML